MNKDLQIELLKKDVSFKDKQIDKLEKRINKAIEYIEKILPSMDVKNIDVIKLEDTFWGKELLKILKGEE